MSKAEKKRAPNPASLPEPLRLAAQAAYDKKADDVVVLDLRELAVFADYFVVCSGQNTRQVKAMADGVELALRQAGVTPAHVEGYERAEWILLDYFDFIVHVFNAEPRRFYGLERLWGSAVRIEVPDSPA
jgi:ribosome-associated protein